MALDKLVDSSQLDTDLTSVADAIRTKGGTSASLAFPSGFVTAIGNIPTGGGAGYATGTVTPTSRVASITFDAGFSTIHGIAIVPTSESPFKSGGRTLGAFLAIPSTIWQSIICPSVSAGGSAQTWKFYTNNQEFTVSGTSVTVTISSPGNNGYFETVSYTWVAW